MRLSRPIKSSLLLPLLFIAAQKVCAQIAPADDFFNSGAQFYISNNIPAAEQQVETGLKIYPDDEKLKKLAELLKQQQQSQNSQSQQNQSQQNQSQKDQQSQQQQNQQQPSQPNSSEQQKQDSQSQAEGKKDEAQKSAGEKQNGEGQPVASGQMTTEEAKRLLDAQKGDEQILQMQPKNKPEDMNRPVKDW
jgi:Ca-activated chloride channel family protein